MVCYKNLVFTASIFKRRGIVEF